MSWKKHGGHKTNKIVTNIVETNEIFKDTADNTASYVNNPSFSTILGIGTETPFSRLSFGKYDISIMYANANYHDNITDDENNVVLFQVRNPIFKKGGRERIRGGQRKLRKREKNVTGTTYTHAYMYI